MRNPFPLVVSSLLLATVANAVVSLGMAQESSTPASSSTRETDSQRAEANAIVRTALELELAGNHKYRDLALKAVVADHPENEAARWQLGRVKHDGQWIPAAECNASNEQSESAYRRQRDKALGHPKLELSLGKWCRRNGMPDRAELHLSRVSFDANVDPSLRNSASKLLKLEMVNGMLMGPKQKAAWISRRDKLVGDWNRWQPKAKKWLKRYKTLKQRTKIAVEVAAVRDPAAIFVLERLIAPVDEELTIATITALSEIQHPDATRVLLQFALAPDSTASAKAATALKDRPLHEYVPTLVGSLESRFKSQYRLQTSALGGVAYQHVVGKEELEADYLQGKSLTLRDTNVPFQPLDFDERKVEERQRTIQDNQLRALVASVVNAANTEARVSMNNAKIDVKNDRIFSILETTLNAKLPRDAKKYWAWWIDYNGVEMPYRPTYSTYMHRYALQPQQDVCSCFVAGTLVWTELGQRPIEQIRIGDRVLSQNPETGELAYRLVQARTIRPPSPTLKITADQNSIVTTLGHPFWKSGTGWRMAKLLEEGDAIRTVHGSIVVDGIEKTPEFEAYNLIVDEFATYFVGSRGVLVHDNTFRSPIRAKLPGMPVME